MTKIKLYAVDNNITGSDKWIGSDGNMSNITKNFTPKGLADFFNSSGSIDRINAIMFKYDTVDDGDERSIGSISFQSEVGPSVSFDSISNLMFHKNTSDGIYIVDLMTSFNGNIVMFQKVDDNNIFAFYKMTSYVQNIDENNFYDVSLSYIDGNGTIDEDEFYFVSLLQFDSIKDTDKHYVHTQSSASATWSVSHNLNKFPSVSMVLSTGQKGYGDVTYIDNNNLTITFAGAETGKAYIN